MVLQELLAEYSAGSVAESCSNQSLPDVFANISYWTSKCLLEKFITTYTEYSKTWIALPNTYILGRLSSLLSQFQDRSSHEGLPRSGTPPAASSCRRANFWGNFEVFVSYLLFAPYVWFLVLVGCKPCVNLHMMYSRFIDLYRRGTEESWILPRNGNATSLDNVRWVSTHIQRFRVRYGLSAQKLRVRAKRLNGKW